MSYIKKQKPVDYSRRVQPKTVATSHLWLLSSWYVNTATDKLTFQYKLNSLTTLACFGQKGKA